MDPIMRPAGKTFFGRKPASYRPTKQRQDAVSPADLVENVQVLTSECTHRTTFSGKFTEQ